MGVTDGIFKWVGLQIKGCRMQALILNFALEDMHLQ
jgi:hypothetical protein